MGIPRLHLQILSPNCYEIGPYLYLFTEVVDEEYVEETVEFFMKEEVEPASKEQFPSRATTLAPPELMCVRGQQSPGQPSALSGHVMSSRHACCHVLLLTGFHPCSVSNGTGKLNINIIYSKCHKCKVETGLAVVLIYDLRGKLLNFRLWKVILALCARFGLFLNEMLGVWFQNCAAINYSQFSNSVTGVIQKIICYKTLT